MNKPIESILQILYSDGSKENHPLERGGAYVLGRKNPSESVDPDFIGLADRFSSRRHCRLYWVEEEESGATVMMGKGSAHKESQEGESWGAAGWMVEDLNSSNGTFLNNNEIDQPIFFPKDGILKIGRTEITLQSPKKQISVLEKKENIFDSESGTSIQKKLSAKVELAPLTQTIAGSWSNINEIRQLAALFQEGILTQEEFQAKKRQLLELSFSVDAEEKNSTPKSAHIGEGVAYVVEVGSYAQKNALIVEELLAKWGLQIFRRHIDMGQNIFYLVQLGPFKERSEAIQAVNRVQNREEIEDIPGSGRFSIEILENKTRPQGRFQMVRKIYLGWPGVDI
ncbi:MAG: FHA domain-containing protein [Magnetococcus sp. DMHC-6]